MKVKHVRLAVLGILIFLVPFLVSAQSFFLQDPPAKKTKLSFKYYRFIAKHSDNISLLSGIYDFSISVPVNSKLNFVGSVPVAACSTKYDWYYSENDSKISVQNISVGLQYILKSTANKSTSITGGVYLPTASRDDSWNSYYIGIYSNPLEYPKFLPKVISFYGTLAHRITTPNGFTLGAEISPRFMVATDLDDDSDEAGTKFVINYGLTGGYRVSDVAFNVEFAGMMDTSEEYGDSDSRFVNMMSFGVQYMKGHIRPGVYYAIHFNKYFKEYISGVIGLKVDIEL